LLLIMRENDAFVMMCFIIEHLFPDYWTHNLTGVQIDLLVIDSIFKKKTSDIIQTFI